MSSVRAVFDRIFRQIIEGPCNEPVAAQYGASPFRPEAHTLFLRQGLQLVGNLVHERGHVNDILHGDLLHTGHIQQVLDQQAQPLRLPAQRPDEGLILLFRVVLMLGKHVQPGLDGRQRGAQLVGGVCGKTLLCLKGAVQPQPHSLKGVGQALDLVSGLGCAALRGVGEVLRTEIGDLIFQIHQRTETILCDHIGGHTGHCDGTDDIDDALNPVFEFRPQAPILRV